MIKSNLIRNDKHKSYAVDFSIAGEEHKVICEYLFILFNLVKNGVIETDSIDMFSEIVKLSIKECKDFDEFASGVISTYLKSKKKGD